MFNTSINISITDDECQRAISKVAKDLRKGFFQPAIALRGLRGLACQLRRSSSADPDLRKGVDKHITYVLQHGLVCIAQLCTIIVLHTQFQLIEKAIALIKNALP